MCLVTADKLEVGTKKNRFSGSVSVIMESWLTTKVIIIIILQLRESLVMKCDKKSV